MPTQEDMYNDAVARGNALQRRNGGSGAQTLQLPTLEGGYHGAPTADVSGIQDAPLNPAQLEQAQLRQRGTIDANTDQNIAAISKRSGGNMSSPFFQFLTSLASGTGAASIATGAADLDIKNRQGTQANQLAKARLQNDSANIENQFRLNLEGVGQQQEQQQFQERQYNDRRLQQYLEDQRAAAAASQPPGTINVAPNGGTPRQPHLDTNSMVPHY